MTPAAPPLTPPLADTLDPLAKLKSTHPDLLTPLKGMLDDNGIPPFAGTSYPSMSAPEQLPPWFLNSSAATGASPFPTASSFWEAATVSPPSVMFQKHQQHGLNISPPFTPSTSTRTTSTIFSGASTAGVSEGAGAGVDASDRTDSPQISKAMELEHRLKSCVEQSQQLIHQNTTMAQQIQQQQMQLQTFEQQNEYLRQALLRTNAAFMQEQQQNAFKNQYQYLGASSFGDSQLAMAEHRTRQHMEAVAKHMLDAHAGQLRETAAACQAHLYSQIHQQFVKEFEQFEKDMDAVRQRQMDLFKAQCEQANMERQQLSATRDRQQQQEQGGTKKAMMMQKLQQQQDNNIDQLRQSYHNRERKLREHLDRVLVVEQQDTVATEAKEPQTDSASPTLDPYKSKVDGLAFLGLSLARNHYNANGGNGNKSLGHEDSLTHQTSFDLNLVLDRNYDFVMSTNDDGWLVGGGEAGPPTSYKLAAKDSAHVEIMRIGTYEKNWGGVSQQEIIDVMMSGKILIPQIDVVPTAVVANPNTPPELEIRFDMIPSRLDRQSFLPLNWQLRFIHNQLFKYFEFPSRFCPGAFHSTIVRKAEFRSAMHEKEYFRMCQRVVEKWQEEGPKPLNTVPRNVDGTPILEEKQESAVAKTDQAVEEEKKENDLSATSSPPASQYQSGIWLFTDRNNPTHFFQPNFLPPYDTPEKKKIIYHFLKEEWDEAKKQWRSAGDVEDVEDEDDDDVVEFDTDGDDDDENALLEKLFERMGLTN